MFFVLRGFVVVLPVIATAHVPLCWAATGPDMLVEPDIGIGSCPTIVTGAEPALAGGPC
jgi:hypothetical protein